MKKQTFSNLPCNKHFPSHVFSCLLAVSHLISLLFIFSAFISMSLFLTLFPFVIFCLLVVSFSVSVSHLPRHGQGCCYPPADVTPQSACDCLTQWSAMGKLRGNHSPLYHFSAHMSFPVCPNSSWWFPTASESHMRPITPRSSLQWFTLIHINLSDRERKEQSVQGKSRGLGLMSERRIKIPTSVNI